MTKTEFFFAAVIIWLLYQQYFWFGDNEDISRLDLNVIKIRSAVGLLTPDISHLTRGIIIGRTDLVEWLLKDGRVDPNESDGTFITATEYRNSEMMELLLKDGRVDSGKLLVTASDFGRLSMVELLLERGADPRSSDDRAFFSASFYGHIEILKSLFKYSRTNYSDAPIEDCLLFAIRGGRNEMVKFLLETILSNNDRIDPVKDTTIGSDPTTEEWIDFLREMKLDELPMFFIRE